MSIIDLGDWFTSKDGLVTQERLTQGVSGAAVITALVMLVLVRALHRALFSTTPATVAATATFGLAVAYALPGGWFFTLLLAGCIVVSFGGWFVAFVELPTSLANLARLRVDESGLVLELENGGSRSLAWDQIREVYLSPETGKVTARLTSAAGPELRPLAYSADTVELFDQHEFQPRRDVVAALRLHGGDRVSLRHP